MAVQNYESLRKKLKQYGTKKPKDPKLMEEYIAQTDKNYKDGDKN